MKPVKKLIGVLLIYAFCTVFSLGLIFATSDETRLSCERLDEIIACNLNENNLFGLYSRHVKVNNLTGWEIQESGDLPASYSLVLLDNNTKVLFSRVNSGRKKVYNASREIEVFISYKKGRYYELYIGHKHWLRYVGLGILIILIITLPRKLIKAVGFIRSDRKIKLVITDYTK